MKTKIIQESETQLAKEILKAGGIAALATDTVFGLGVIANNHDAINNLRRVKQRPDEKVFAYMVDSIEKIEEVCELTPYNRYLIKRWLPGPLTFIFKKKENNKIVSQSELKTLAIRIPNHPFIINLIREMDTGLYVPSANISGQPTCLNVKEVQQQFDGHIDGIVNANPYGQQASTIIDCSQEKLVCLREGMISFKEIMEDYNEYFRID